MSGEVLMQSKSDVRVAPIKRHVISRRAAIGGFAMGVLAAPAVVRNAFALSTELVPFKYTARPEDLADLKQRLRTTRLPEHETVTDWSPGVPLQKLRSLIEYWSNSYDWRKTEAHLNKFEQFRTEIDGLWFHFLHVRSPHRDALPLIITHGWPSTVLEFHKVLEPLTDPTQYGATKQDAFHLVVPSMPGFGFSGKPNERGWNGDRTARAWGVLMNRLGYQHYVAQGGDWGSFVTTKLAQQKPPGLAAIHLTMPQVVPDKMPTTLTEKEARAADRLKRFKDDHFGYFIQQATKPQTVAYGLADSPSGQAAWIYEHFYNVTDNRGNPEDALSPDDMLDEITLYWLTNSAASSARFYLEQREQAAKPNQGRVDLPVGCSIFPRDVYQAPRSWAEQFFPNLIYWNELDRGGHFAPLEQPSLFAQELRNCFRSQRST
jgi:pimeloyl-ACP methyl ester carboxylesterase